MFSYLILTYLLSGLGIIFYLLGVRNRLSSQGQKNVLLCTVLGSLVIPLAFIYYYDFNPPKNIIHLQHKQLSQEIFTEFCPPEDMLDACYDLAQSDEKFCNCERFEKKNLLMYHSEPIYEVLWWQQNAFWRVFLVGLLLVSIFLLIKINYLKRLVKSSVIEPLKFNNETIFLLKNPKKLSVGSFFLLKKYIIWQDEINELNPQEKEAILWHELSHIHQRDTYIHIFTNMLQSIWIINPAFYFIRKELNRLSEYIADELAVVRTGNKKQYAQLLLKMETHRHSRHLQHFKESLLKQRIKHILKFSPPPQQFSPLNIAVITTILGVLSLTSNISFPLLSRQIDKLKVYQTLSEAHSNNGKSVFCGHCLLEEVE